MERDHFSTRLKDIQHFIIEIATGNFLFRLEPNDNQDETEAMVVLLNMMAEELRFLFHQIDPTKSTEQILKMMFIVDDNMRILQCNDTVPDLLMISPRKLNKMEFEKILARESKERFNKKIGKNGKIQAIKNFEIPLDFKTSESLLAPADCFFQKLNTEKPRYLIVALKTVYKNKELERILKNSTLAGTFSKNSVLRREFNRRLIKRIHFYILENLDRTLPSLKEIAGLFNTNETKLKKGFKQMYGTTIYRFHNEKRLDKALTLICNTELSIKQVSAECGFKDLSHFSRKFKKKFGRRPTDFRQKPM